MTLAEKIVIRDRALAAYQKALDGANYSVSSGGGSRSYQRQDLQKLRAEYEYWQAEVAKEENGNTRDIRFIVPRY